MPVLKMQKQRHKSSNRALVRIIRATNTPKQIRAIHVFTVGERRERKYQKKFKKTIKKY